MGTALQAPPDVDWAGQHLPREAGDHTASPFARGWWPDGLNVPSSPFLAPRMLLLEEEDTAARSQYSVLLSPSAKPV